VLPYLLFYFQKNLVHRLVYIGKLKEGIEDRQEVGSKS